MVGMTLVSRPERWDELGTAETLTLLGKGLRAPVAPSRAGGSKSGGKQELSPE